VIRTASALNGTLSRQAIWAAWRSEPFATSGRASSRIASAWRPVYLSDLSLGGWPTGTYPETGIWEVSTRVRSKTLSKAAIRACERYTLLVNF
jgi:hypothetical protein